MGDTMLLLQPDLLAAFGVVVEPAYLASQDGPGGNGCGLSALTTACSNSCARGGSG